MCCVWPHLDYLWERDIYKDTEQCEKEQGVEAGILEPV